MTVNKHDQQVLSSDAIHNHNAFNYLLELKPYITKEILDLDEIFSQISQLPAKYDENQGKAYGDLYSTILTFLDDNIDEIDSHLSNEHKKALDNLIIAIYDNDNKIIDNALWINTYSNDVRPLDLNPSHHITRDLNSTKPSVNRLHPTQTGTMRARTQGVLSPNFKLQLGTNIPTIKNYTYKKRNQPREYRFGTQAQRHNGIERVSPLFKHWLRIKAQASTKKTAHVYFNNLAYDRSRYDFEGSKERALSLELHKLEEDPSLKIVVITLPASKSLFGDKHYQLTKDSLSYNDVFDELLTIADKEQHPSQIVDFHISKAARELLFQDELHQKAMLNKLLTQSFQAMGIDAQMSLTTAQKQAVWLHFIKFELTDYIITTLKPDGYNFSCKDAIDRGALSSIYYNLHKSFQTDNPMNKEEFERSLDAAAASVKGRGMNFHRRILWNALDKYINAHELLQDKDKAWLVFWRDMNCPHSQVHSLLGRRIADVRAQIKTLPVEKDSVKEIADKLLNAIEISHKQQVSGQRLIFELLARTSQLLNTAQITDDDVVKYKALANELRVNYPKLHILGGLAEAFLGVLLLIPSLGYSSKLIKDGISTAKTGFFSAKRTQLCEEAEQLVNELKPPNK